MTRSLLFQFVGLTAVVTAIVGALLIFVVPNGQRQELEASASAELSSLAAAYAVSVTSALEQEDLEALARLNSSVRDDPRNLTVAIISGFGDTAELFAVFPGNSPVTTADFDSDRFLVARQPAIVDGRVPVLGRDAFLHSHIGRIQENVPTGCALSCALVDSFANSGLYQSRVKD